MCFYLGEVGAGSGTCPCVCVPMGPMPAGIHVFPCSSLSAVLLLADGVLACFVGAVIYTQLCTSGVHIYSGVND